MDEDLSPDWDEANRSPEDAYAYHMYGPSIGPPPGWAPHDDEDIDEHADGFLVESTLTLTPPEVLQKISTLERQSMLPHRREGPGEELSRPTPSRSATFLFLHLAPLAYRREAVGDLLEEYGERVAEAGRLRARLWYWGQVLGSFASCVSALVRRARIWSFGT